MSQTNKLPQVLTIDEVAAYLRLPKETVERQAVHGQIPGRCIETTWRFLKAAIDEWLQSQDSRSVLLQQAGAFADDETLPALRKAIYRKRGRSETDPPSKDLPWEWFGVAQDDPSWEALFDDIERRRKATSNKSPRATRGPLC